MRSNSSQRDSMSIMAWPLRTFTAYRIGTRRFSASVIVANGRGNWKLRARPSRVRSCAAIPSSFRPANRTLPLSLRSVPQMQFTSVLLPEPLGPTRPTRSPCCTASSISASAMNPPKRLPTPLTSSNAPSLIAIPAGGACVFASAWPA